MYTVSRLLPNSGSAVKLRLLQHLRPGAVQSSYRWQTTSPGAASAAAERDDSDDDSMEKTIIADILAKKGSREKTSTFWCTTEDTVFDAVKAMTSHNIGALVVKKLGSSDSIAGIITERDYLRKIAVEGRSSKTTSVGEVMTIGDKLVTVSPDTKVLKAMELMTKHRIRHIPVIKDGKMKAMVSIGDVVRAVVDENREEVKRLSDFIQGSYTA